MQAARLRPFHVKYRTVLFVAGTFVACAQDASPVEVNTTKLAIKASGSLQNPAWAPDGRSLLITRFQDGYNTGPADLLVVNITSGDVRTLVSDGSTNVNLPGSVWNADTGIIVFSSSRGDHDEIYTTNINASPGDEIKITDRSDTQAYEPALSPDATWVVFESHAIDVEDNGVITRFRRDGSGSYENLTAEDDDCRQPNWSPDGKFIAYQKLSGGQWDLWLVDEDGTNHRKITSGEGNKTDASFSADSSSLVFSADNSDIEFANLFRFSLFDSKIDRITNHSVYDGAPSLSPDGHQVAYESIEGDPDDSSGTQIWRVQLAESEPRCRMNEIGESPFNRRRNGLQDPSSNRGLAR